MQNCPATAIISRGHASRRGFSTGSPSGPGVADHGGGGAGIGAGSNGGAWDDDDDVAAGAAPSVPASPGPRPELHAAASAVIDERAARRTSAGISAVKEDRGRSRKESCDTGKSHAH